MDISSLQLRPLDRETVISACDQVVIAAPSEKSGIVAAEKVQEALKAAGCNADLLINPAAEVIKEAAGPVFVIGNLANSLCARELYFLFFILTDRWYPGPGGYEVRTLMDPLGTGHNIIHLGYSDDGGLESGLSVLLDKVADPLPFLSEVHAVRFPLPAFEVEEIRQASLPAKDYEMARTESAVGKCYLGYLSDDEELLRESSIFWEALVRYGVPPGDHRIKDLHLRTPYLVSLFRLMEQVGMIEERLRLPILQFICELAESDQGVCHIDVPAYQNEGIPRQNHGLIPALGYVMAADYFNRHHPELEEPYRWKKIAEGVFAPYNNGSWKPLCDCLCHGWVLSQPAMLDYALFDPEHRYLVNGGVRKAADCVLAVTNNQGWMPSTGDSTHLRAFAGPTLRVAAAWYEDGRYRYVHELAPEYRRHYLIAFLQRTFCTDVEPVEPEDDVGLTIIPMDPLVYHIWDANPELAKERTDKPPHAPIEKCFDKLVFRSGWNINDDCLVVDGLGHFSHSYADAMEIIEYARYGLSLIVSEHGHYFPEPESHSIVTITRNGEVGPIPGWAEILESECDDEGNGYVSLRLEDFAGADWIRELHFRKGVGVVIHDTITAMEPGEYAIQTHLRVPGRASLQDNTLISRKKSPTAGDVEFRIKGSSSEDTAYQLEEVDVSLWHRNAHDNTPPPEGRCRIKMWKDRYHTEDRVISIFKGRIATSMEPGESVCFTQFAQAIGPDDSEYDFKTEGGTVVLSGEGQSWRLPVSGRRKRTGTVEEGTGVKVPEMERTELVRFPAKVNCMSSVGEDKILCGLDNGLLVLADISGAVEWETQLKGTVHDATALDIEGGSMFFAGHGDTGLTALDEKGEVTWTQNIVRDPTSCAHWELTDASAVQVKAFRVDDSSLIAVGCGDLQVRIFNADGEQTGSFLYQNGVPGRVRICDVDGDGIPEIVVGGEIISNQATCRILTPEAALKYELRIEGWTSKLTSWTHGVVKNRNYVACGASRGRNLHIYELPAPDAAPVHVLEKNLGGAVTGVGLFPNEEFVAAGTTMGFVVAYGFDGTMRWQSLMEHGVAGLTVLNNSIIVWDDIGGCRQFSLKGEVLAETQLDGPVRQYAVAANNKLYLSHGETVTRLNPANK